MSVIEERARQSEVVERDRSGPSNRGLIAVIIVLAAALVAGGAWVIFDRSSDVDADIQEVLDAYYEGSNSYDADAWARFVADDYTAHFAKAFPPWGLPGAMYEEERERMLANFEVYFPSRDFRWETVGEPIVIGDGPWLVAQEYTVHSVDPGPTPVTRKAIALLTIIEEDGQLRVLRDINAGYDL